MVEQQVFLERLRSRMAEDEFLPRIPYVPLPPGELPRPIFVGAPSGVDAFIDEWEALGGNVHVVDDASDVAAAVSHAVAGRRPVAVSEQAGLSGVDADMTWPACGMKDLADAKVGVLKAEAAIAATGSVVVDSASTSGRSISLLPDVAIFVVDVASIVDTPSDLLRLHDQRWPDGPPSQVVLVSGPSRSADIEMTLTVGVHGPGEVHVVLVRTPSSTADETRSTPQSATDQPPRG